MSRIAFVTDLHTLENNVEKKGVDTVQNWKTVLEDLKKKDISRLILGGDNGEKESLKMLFQDITEFNYDFILGNHDKIKNYHEQAPETADKGEYFFKLKIGRSDCIFLDTSSYKLNDEQQNFLEKWLHNAECPVIFIHHPVLNIGSWMDREHPLKNRDEVKKLLHNSGKKITLVCGHYHQFHQSEENDIRQIIAPAVSYQIPYNRNYQSDISNFGYLILDFSGEEIMVEEVKFSTEK